jgi:hypothetical protein
MMLLFNLVFVVDFHSAMFDYLSVSRIFLNSGWLKIAEFQKIVRSFATELVHPNAQ